jgi:ribosomal protein L11 methyltransferase
MAETPPAIALTREQAYALVDAVMAEDDLAVTASAFEDEATGEWFFEATAMSEPDLEIFRRLAEQTLGGEVDFSVETVDPEVNWVARSLEGLHAVSAGGFYVHGSHEPVPPPAGSTPIRIDAAQAFGTGHHETTTGCLEAISRALKMRRYRKVIDIGTGTGVLAIAVARRSRTRVLATDIDPVATETAAANARDNGVGRLITTLTAPGLEHAVIGRSGPYDLVIANILAGPLIGLAPGVGRLAARGATIILSGVLARQATRVAAAYAGAGMHLRRKLVRRGWVTLVLERG